MGEAVTEWMKEKGVIHDVTAPYTPQQNGVVGRWNRTMMEGVRTLLHEALIGDEWWAEALRHIMWVKNRTPHRALPNHATPCEF